MFYVNKAFWVKYGQIGTKAKRSPCLLFKFSFSFIYYKQMYFCRLCVYVYILHIFHVNSNGGDTIWKISWCIFVFKLYQHDAFPGVIEDMISQMELHKIYIEISATDTFRRRTCIKSPFDRRLVHFSGRTSKWQKSET